MIHHLSFSQVDSFNSCQKKWFVEKVLGEESPPGTAASRGSQFDQLLSVRMGLRKIEECDSLWDAKKKVKLDLIDRVEEAVDFYLAHPDTWKEATSAQEKLVLTPGQWDIFADLYGVGYKIPAPIIGYLDLLKEVDGGLRRKVTDLKTSTRAEFRPSWAIQCTLYALVKRAFQFEVHLLTFTKALKIRVYSYRPTKDTFQWAMNFIGNAAQQMEQVSKMKTVDNVPAFPGYYCSWCPRSADCEASLVGRLT